jgi:hypothetical protein
MSVQGLALAGFSALGSAACEFARKKLTGAGMDPSTIISLVCLIEGVFGLSGLTVANGEPPMPPVSFWFPALASAGLSALTATLLTKAYSENDISLCAPFNAALPVFQFLMTFVYQDEAKLPVHKVAGVFCVCASSFWLARAGRKEGSANAPLLPPGALPVLFCCFIWSIVTKFDQEATKAAGSPIVYVCFAKLLTGVWAAIGAAFRNTTSTGKAASSKKEQPDRERGAAERSLRLLVSQPTLLLVLLGVAATEGAYMAAWFAALSKVSKVFCVAIKKGGNLLITSVGGWLLFGEQSEGRILPVLGVVAGVGLMTV